MWKGKGAWNSAFKELQSHVLLNHKVENKVWGGEEWVLRDGTGSGPSTPSPFSGILSTGKPDLSW